MRKILIVEDNDLVRELITNMLEDEFEITECANGNEALEKIADQTFDLIITDVKMPEKGGLELASTIKDKRLALPILAISGNFTEETEGIASYFADDILPKPFTEEDLRDAVRNLLSNKSVTDLYG